MERGFVENGFIIDLSNTKNTTQLVFELSSIMEHPEVKGKSICLKLGIIIIILTPFIYCVDKLNGIKYHYNYIIII